MKFTEIFLLLLASSVRLAAGNQDGWMAVEPPISARWDDSLPVYNTHRAALVLDSPAVTRLRGVLLPAPFADPGLAVENRVTKLLDTLQLGKEALLTLDWLGEKPTIMGFHRAIHGGDDRVRSVYRSGTTTLTRTILCSQEDDAIFIHMLADQPGALSFRVTLAGDAKIEDRRQLVLTPVTGLASHVWVLPFESDVAPDGKSIVVKGEGEALIVWSFSAENAPDSKISGLLTKLGERHDPGHQPPDPTRIWQGVLAAHLKSAQNSP